MNSNKRKVFALCFMNIPIFTDADRAEAPAEDREDPADSDRDAVTVPAVLVPADPSVPADFTDPRALTFTVPVATAGEVPLPDTAVWAVFSPFCPSSLCWEEQSYCYCYDLRIL